MKRTNWEEIFHTLKLKASLGPSHPRIWCPFSSPPFVPQSTGKRWSNVRFSVFLHTYRLLVGLLLTLFGGSQRGNEGRAHQSFSIRTDTHLLLVGDPGLGKSQLITAASAVAPRGLYVCGNTCTSAGLTATLHHEGASGEYGLEAGALVLADRGCCCIDEFDKITEPRVLLDVMEQQQVNVAKAGVVCSLPARTSIIAAANPVGGHYKYQQL